MMENKRNRPSDYRPAFGQRPVGTYLAITWRCEVGETRLPARRGYPDRW